MLPLHASTSVCVQATLLPRSSFSSLEILVSKSTMALFIGASPADVDSTTLTKTLSGGVWNTNLVISLVTGVASSVVYSVAASPFDTAKLTAVLWLASVLIDLKDASYDIGSLKDSKLQTGVAAVAAYLAFA